MAQMIAVAAGAIGLIVFVSFIAARLVRSRTAGMSVRMQVFLALSLIVGAFAFGLGLLVLDRVKARADLVGREAAAGEARAVAALVAAELESGRSLADVSQRLRGTQKRQATGGPHLALIDAHGKTVFRSGRSPNEPGTVNVQVPILVRDRPRGQVRVVKPTLMIQRTLADFAPTVLVLSLLLGAVAAGAAALIGRTIATPIEALSRFAERVSEGDRRAPPPMGHGREVLRLSKALDSMRRELQGRPFVETFAADLSHELKNPVAAIRASAEVLVDGALDEREQAARFVERILESTSRIEALLGDLLSLARLEARGLEEADRLDLRDIAKSATRSAQQRGIDVNLTATTNMPVRGEQAWLTRGIENLIDNGHIHGLGSISLRLERREDWVDCYVRHAGQVKAEVRQRLFRRFVTTRADRGGTGLGLPIVRAIAESHGGEVDCTLPGPPEVEFRLSLPAS